MSNYRGEYNSTEVYEIGDIVMMVEKIDMNIVERFVCWLLKKERLTVEYLYVFKDIGEKERC